MQMSQSASRKKADDLMFLTIVIFVMILWPVLLPALITACPVVANQLRTFRRVAQPG
jgi:hypothetical protein